VRKIEIFAATHVFADLMILLALIILVVYGSINLSKNGRNTGVPFINEKTFTDAIGFSVYAFEGIGMILPVQDITKNPDGYKSIVIAVILTVCTVYVTFGYFCVNAWGDQMTTPLITDELPSGWVTYIILLLFSLNLVFSYPLVLYPAHIIIENIIYAGWPKSRKRQMLKNNSRTLLVFFTVCLTIMLGDKLDKFLSVLGALTCTPIAFTFPALFHYKAAA
jgi:proton-coupled amino acid transporter